MSKSQRIDNSQPRVYVPTVPSMRRRRVKSIKPRLTSTGNRTLRSTSCHLDMRKFPIVYQTLRVRTIRNNG